MELIKIYTFWLANHLLNNYVFNQLQNKNNIKITHNQSVKGRGC